MCGICGIINRYDKVSLELLHSMNETLYHRGPDSSGIFINENVALGMRRLSIIDLRTGSQPHYNETKKIVCVCNGEIYNFKELRLILKNKGHKFYSQSDIEVIPHLYEQYGESFPQYLTGMFAIALYDLNINKLLLVRDIAGEKPLYYSVINNNFYFASEIKSLLKIPFFDRQINYSALYSYFQFRYVPAPETAYNNIYKLKPSSILMFKDNNITISKYWDVASIEINNKISIHDAKEKLHKLLKISVASQMISDVPLGAFLSGGVDSSIVVLLMQQLSNTKIKTFSIKYSEKSYDESKYAKKIANYLSTDHTEFEVDSNIKASIIKIIEAFDEPFADSSAIPVYLLSKLTKENVSVALSGDGGDELFGGYSRYKGMQLVLRFNYLPYFIRCFFMNLMSNVIKDSDKKIEVSVSRKILRFIKFYNEIQYSNNTFLPSIDSKRMSILFTNDFYNQINTTPLFKCDFNFDTFQKKLIVDKMMRHDFEYYLPDDILTKVDRMSMVNSLETRAPFLDKNVVKFAYSLPVQYKIKNGITKYILKESFKNDLPNNILYRPKQGFVVPLAKWFKGELNNYFKDIIHKNNLSIFNNNTLMQLLNEHELGMKDNSDMLWTLLCFSVWWSNNI